MSSLSQFTGGGGVPVGATVTILDGPVLISANGQEYLRGGNLKTYDSSYAASIAVAPQLGAYGTLANSYGDTTSSSSVARVYYAGANYFRLAPSYTGYYSSTLSGLSTSPSISGGGGLNSMLPTVLKPNVIGQGNGYLVGSGAVNTALLASPTASTFTAVGGTFTTHPIRNMVAYLAGFGWLSLSAINGAAGSRSYIANANPTGTWTVDTPAALTGNSAVYAAATNGSIIVVVGGSPDANWGKIVTSATLNGEYTDRTPTCGITFYTTDTMYNCVYSGSRFLATCGTTAGGANRRIITSTDGLTWTESPIPLEQATASITGLALAAFYLSNLVTDGAGTVVVAINSSDPANARALFMVSSDGGVTWKMVQCARANRHALSNNVTTTSYANGRFFVSYSGASSSPSANNNVIDVGTATDLAGDPAYIGSQANYFQGCFVRIK